MFVIAFMESADDNFELIADGIFSEAGEARERAYEAQRCRSNRQVGIYRLAEFVTTEFSTKQVEWRS